MKFVCICILIFSFSFAVSAQKCEDENASVYASYISELQAGIDTIHRFNLPFLAKELAANKIDEDELSKRLSRYTLTLDKLNSNISINGFYNPNRENCDFFVYKVSGSKLGYGNFVFVRLVDKKIVNISFEEGSTELDGRELSQLLYIVVK